MPRNGLIEEKQLATKLYLSAERVSRQDEFEHHLQIARDRSLGIEIQEFYLPELMWGNWKPRLEQYKQLLEGFDNGLSIHNAFYCTDHAGLDPEIFRLTRMRYDYIFKIAQDLGCETVVSHFMWLPRYKGSHLMRWQEAEVRFWDPYINKAEKLGFVLALENTFEPGPETLVPIFDRLKSVHFKWNLDVGHVNAFAQNNSLAEWIDALHPHLSYMHVHNNHGEEDSHNPVMDGTIDFEQLFERLNKWQVAPIVATEIYGQGLIESVDYLEKIMAATRCYGD